MLEGVSLVASVSSASLFAPGWADAWMGGACRALLCRCGGDLAGVGLQEVAIIFRIVLWTNSPRPPRP